MTRGQNEAPWSLSAIFFMLLLLFEQDVYGVRAGSQRKFRGVKRDDQWLRWCGKHYQQGSPADSQFVLDGRSTSPAASSAPLLDIRCTPMVQPYLSSDTTGSIIIDANVTHDVGQALPSDFSESSTPTLNVTVFLASSPSSPLVQLQMPVGSIGAEASFSLASLPPATTPYNLTCSASLSSSSSARFITNTTLRRLPPNPYNGSVTKIDRRTGAMLRQSSSGNGSWDPILTFGFYTGFDALASNLSIVDQMKAIGLNTIHLIPPYDNLTALQSILDKADSAGISYMADFRDIYQNLSAVSPFVELFRKRKGLLAWYTNDEPDGPGDDPAATTAAYEFLYSNDGYHPVSLVLNCWDFHWTDYTSGADIVLSDPYPIAVNTTFSHRYGTVCNATYGCCGCDDCTGDLTDITNKMDTWSERRRFAGRDRNLAIWSVPQAFDGTTEFWERVPTGPEFKLQTIMAVNHGAVGIMPWDAPTTDDITQAAAQIAPVFSKTLAPWLLDPTATRLSLTQYVNESKVDVAAWARPATNSSSAYEALILAANLNYETVVIRIDLGGAQLTMVAAPVQSVFGNATADGSGALILRLDSTGISGHILPLSSAPISTTNANTTTTDGPNAKGKARSAGSRICESLLADMWTRECLGRWHVGAALLTVALGWLWQQS
ncbi:hypothetical protein PUNSTDRAFT_49317 [Punctularia strigosozonata HHB-11173 SS5]|uniref:uncharacterized protein n=1 Tax=Punctularia strigosozonata (strain HHB-11173) TaxID=741275 RepID=UPI0004417536|nr:uncharacterized protein PUNSTDRAFT_49317 [Punctularia strigosozonata HHB-11173 SS5]EIN14572.1 hypothetical protein PUNSTDRAFT_49317 [Punctularia strigosozonata HHB-11173 SS5]